MKEIYDMILKEKAKDVPNKEYILFLQQMSDKTEVDYFIEENKRKQLEKKIYKQNYINFEDYFRYSGKTEQMKEGVYWEYIQWVNEHKIKTKETPISKRWRDNRNETNINQKIK